MPSSRTNSIGDLLRYLTSVCLMLLVGSTHAADGSRNIGISSPAEKRIALVIGNSAYPGAPLSNPVNDARDMAVVLKKLGFDVIEKTDATQKEMNRAIAQFGEKLRADTAALFFYAGHGMQMKGKNYLIPIDAQIQSEASARAEAVDVETVMDQLAISPLNIVILDACRNNPFERRFRSVGGGLAQMDAPKGSLIAYATAPGKVASDGTGRNGLYTQELLKHIQTPGLTLEAVFKRVRNGVIAGSGELQTPWESSSLTGDFYFINSGTTVVNLPQPARAEASRIDPEVEAWKVAESANSQEAIEAYLRTYPKGKFAAAASVKLAVLRAAGKAAASRPEASRSGSPEDDVWAAVEKGGSADDYDAYLVQYPKGKYAVLAKNRKTRFEQAALTARQQETDAWTAAESLNSKEGYETYLKAYPSGQYATLARSRQAKAIQDEAARNVASSGQRILGQWGDRLWYPGTIRGQSGDLLHVVFDDGDKADLPKSRIRPIDWGVGTIVQCNWKGKGRYYSGTITRSNGLDVHISYDDGDQEDTSISKCRSR